MYYYMSLCNIPFLTSSLEPLHVFVSSFALMFLRWTPTKFVRNWVLPLFFMELWEILCNFWPNLKGSVTVRYIFVYCQLLSLFAKKSIRLRYIKLHIDTFVMILRSEHFK